MILPGWPHSQAAYGAAEAPRAHVGAFPPRAHAGAFPAARHELLASPHPNHRGQPSDDRARTAKGGRGCPRSPPLPMAATAATHTHEAGAPMTQRICTLAAVGSASHWAAGPPAAEMSAYVMPDVVIAHGKWMPLDWTMKPTNAAMATRPCLISAWRRKPIEASWPAENWS